MISLLLVEDDENLGFVIKDNLELGGKYHVYWEKDGKKALQIFENRVFDLCVLDVMLPKIDGFTIASTIRKSGSIVPIIFLTAKTLKEDLVKGFQLGGDDYLTKPFSMEELLIRIEALLRRTQKNEKNEKIVLGNYSLNNQTLELEINDKIRQLTDREAKLLLFLGENRNQTVSREKILFEIWGDNDYFKGRSLDVFMTRLRKYLSEDSRIKIINIHGVGFRLIIENN